MLLAILKRNRSIRITLEIHISYELYVSILKQDIRSIHMLLYTNIKAVCPNHMRHLFLLIRQKIGIPLFNI